MCGIVQTLEGNMVRSYYRTTGVGCGVVLRFWYWPIKGLEVHLHVRETSFPKGTKEK